MIRRSPAVRTTHSGVASRRPSAPTAGKPGAGIASSGPGALATSGILLENRESIYVIGRNLRDLSVAFLRNLSVNTYVGLRRWLRSDNYVPYSVLEEES